MRAVLAVMDFWGFHANILCESINLLMQIELEQEPQEKGTEPFEIIHNARSSRASRSRKSSIHTSDRERPKTKTMKLRKMTMNPQTFCFQELEEIAELKNQQKMPRSQQGEIQEEQAFLSDYLELGVPTKITSKKQQELQNCILFGIATERELDSDFNLSGWQVYQHSDHEMRQ